MRKSNFALRLQPSLLEEVRKLAETEGADVLDRAGVGNPPMRGDRLKSK
jgi:hypothetical protein